MVAFSIGVKLLSIITSFIPTEDSIVTTQRHEVPRSKTYVRKYGIPVVDSATGVCGICRIKVPRSTRHCKLCNKCVAGMDHHCRWLNCCIGQRNYRLFMLLITYTFFALVWYSSVAVYTLWSSVYQKNLFAGQAWELFYSNYALKAESTEANTSISRSYYLSIVIAAILVGLSLVGTIAMLRLLCFHIRLACMNTTTVEYINRTSHYRSLYDDTDDEDDYSDDYYDEFSEPDSEVEYDHEENEEEDDLWKPLPSNVSATASSTTNKAAAMFSSTEGGQYIVRSLRLLRKVGRPWRRLVRRYLPGYTRYHQLHQRRGGRGRRHHSLQVNNLFYRGLAFILCRDISTSSKRRKRSRRSRPLHTSSVRHRNVHMEELLATQTIRPTITLDTEEDGGPDYDDDMGLDMSILDEKFSSASSSSSSPLPSSPMNKRYSKGNKAARILDITEEEAMRYQQSHQDQWIQQRQQLQEQDEEASLEEEPRKQLEKADDIV
ncbi:DHHC palmitoyltransferase-domain-containing protein [Phascolomyces articulosus]|uniref:Palmitoyltransferase n=1 Tax=Phascolomyces articulosus TaxID=60185 RepID=A0AAD5PCP4_9FUNG|nr:DHHC palmitoyltransferase-domain-containing protein [Phascolomyces articulosus]